MMRPWASACLGAALLLISAIGAAAPAAAEQINTRFRGLTLLADLELAEGKAIEDGVAVIVHDIGGFAGDGTIAELQKNLGARGVSTMAITISLGVDRRRKALDCAQPQAYRPYDALDEIDAWIGWLENNGAADIALIGYGQGANQVAVYNADRNNPAVSALAVLAPPGFDFARETEAYRARYDADLPELLARAQSLVQAGQTVERLPPVGFLGCADATVSAGAFAAWYAASPLRDTAAMLARQKIRTLAVLPGEAAAYPDLPAEALARLTGGKGLDFQITTIDGADRDFTGEAGVKAAAAIAAWLKG